MKTKILFIFTFCFMGSTIVSCIFDTCDLSPPHFEIIGITSYNLRCTDSGSNTWETIEDNESVSWNSFLVGCWFGVNYIANVTRNFGGTLMASSCDSPGEAGDKIGVDTIIVLPVHDYNENFLAGSIINEIILITSRIYSANNIDEFTSLDTYLSENFESVRDQAFGLKLTEAPANNAPFSFDVTYKLNNGEEFTHRTNEINLTK